MTTEPFISIFRPHPQLFAMPVVSLSYFVVNVGRTIIAAEYSIESAQVGTFDASHQEKMSPTGNGIHRQAGARVAAH